MSDFPLTLDHMKHMFPKAKKGKALYEAMVELLPKYEINTPERIAMFLAQCGHESGGFVFMAENLNYSAKALDAVFGKYFKRGGRDAEEYARKPEKIANVVYASRMGNGDTDSGDGWKFRGRGYIQLTGRDNYTRFADSIGKGLRDAVEYVETVEGALESACWFWDTNGLNKYADACDVKKATKRINGGYNGLEDREHHFEEAMELLTGKAAPKPKKETKKAKGSTSVTLSVGDRGEEVKNMQAALGIGADGIFGPGTKRSVKKFQQANGLTADGVAGPNTLTKLYG
jgi:putative chitinase